MISQTDFLSPKELFFQVSVPFILATFKKAQQAKIVAVQTIILGKGADITLSKAYTTKNPDGTSVRSIQVIGHLSKQLELKWSFIKDFFKGAKTIEFTTRLFFVFEGTPAPIQVMEDISFSIAN